MLYVTNIGCMKIGDSDKWLILLPMFYATFLVPESSNPQ